MSKETTSSLSDIKRTQMVEMMWCSKLYAEYQLSRRFLFARREFTNKSHSISRTCCQIKLIMIYCTIDLWETHAQLQAIIAQKQLRLFCYRLWQPSILRCWAITFAWVCLSLGWALGFASSYLNMPHNLRRRNIPINTFSSKDVCFYACHRFDKIGQHKRTLLQVCRCEMCVRMYTVISV